MSNHELERKDYLCNMNESMNKLKVMYAYLLSKYMQNVEIIYLELLRIIVAIGKGQLDV